MAEIMLGFKKGDKMVEKKTIGLSALSAVLVLILGGVLLTDDSMYFCEDNNKAMVCDSLSKYYSLPNGKCINKNIGNKLCKTGWLEIIDDTILKNITSNDNNIKVKANDNIFECLPDKNNEVTEYTICLSEDNKKNMLGELIHG